jgi:hypothetical protein
VYAGRTCVRSAVAILRAVEGPPGDGLNGVPLRPPQPASIATVAQQLSAQRINRELLIVVPPEA